MKYCALILILIFVACNNVENKKPTPGSEIQSTNPDTLQITNEGDSEVLPSEKYFNDRFKEVTVERIEQDSFVIRGQAQVFEASLNWVVEDGHNELLDGFQTTDAGAPEWGNFEFGLSVVKVRENSTLMLILFEISAEDGSRKHELPIALQ